MYPQILLNFPLRNEHLWPPFLGIKGANFGWEIILFHRLQVSTS